MRERIRRWLQGASPTVFSTYAVAAAFSAYFCMYGFRKPFAAATFEGAQIGEVELKIALVISQIVGYALSKFFSIKVVTEIPPARRALALVALVCVAEIALVFVGLLPPWGKVLAIFFNGLPLGAVWGLVFGFLEGRRTSEILGAGLSASYIVASGAVKSVGRFVMEAGASDAWMPSLTGLLFLPPFLVAVWLLSALPEPDAEDVAARTERKPMDGRMRVAFLREFAFGLTALTALYVFLTAYRDFRDNFAAEIWNELGMGDVPSIFTISEIPVAFVVLVGLALIYRIADNRRAFLTVHGLMLGGTLLIALSTLAYDFGLIGGVTWMITIGTGLYLGYVPYGCMLFDRLIAATGVVGTAVFMIYVTDAFGYAGSVGVLLYRNFGQPGLSWLGFFRTFTYVTAAVCSVAFLASALYFARRTASQDGKG